MKITDENNFCRVFEIPSSFPSEYCFSGVHIVQFKLVDWFSPIRDCETWEESKEALRAFVAGKQYIKSGATYVLITDFGESMIIKEGETK